MDLEGVAVEDLKKSYAGNVVLKGVSLGFRAGQVHALLGANGAGKSTLLGCLSGAAQPDSGVIRIGRSAHRAFSPREAFHSGVAIIYQRFQLIGPLTVADNIFLGQELRKVGGTIDRSRQVREAGLILEQLGMQMDPNATVEHLSVGQQQMVEIARAIRRQPRVLILDEPTAALGTHEVDALLQLVRHLAHDQGLAVVYVTHLLAEVMEVADEVSVLRDGNVLWTKPRGAVTLAQLVEGISPAAAAGAPRRSSRRTIAGQAVLQLERFCSPRTGPVDLTVRGGEIVGFFGLLGSGRTDLLEALAGVRQSSGAVSVDGRRATLASPSIAQKHGIALVASDRMVQSLFGDLSAIENLLMPHYSNLSRGIRRPKREAQLFHRTAAEVSLTPRCPTARADSFSGGNGQKIAVARWAFNASQVRCLLLDEPTQGVDVGARQELHDLIGEYAVKRQAAVIFASSDPEETLALADTVVVLVGGRPVYTGPASALTELELTALAQPESTESAAV